MSKTISPKKNSALVGVPNAIRRKVPLDAGRLEAGRVAFAAEAPEQPGEYPITILARSRDAVNHGYWGWIVHDLGSMRLRKEISPIDYRHKHDEVLGSLDTFDANDPRGLVVSGRLVSFREDDRAAEIIHKGSRGVPYEASIEWDPARCRVEEFGAGHKVTVNGLDFVGPITVIRDWDLMAVAICPYGADHNTRTEFDREPDERELEITIFSQVPMSQTPDPKPAEIPAAEATDPAAAAKAELQRFITRLGAEHGAAAYCAGKSYEAALEEHATRLGADLAAAKAELAEAHRKLQAAALAGGEAQPLNVSPETPAKPSRLDQLGPNRAAYAAGLKLAK